jgi:hypothetical protein
MAINRWIPFKCYLILYGALKGLRWEGSEIHDSQNLASHGGSRKTPVASRPLPWLFSVQLHPAGIEPWLVHMRGEIERSVANLDYFPRAATVTLREA